MDNNNGLHAGLVVTVLVKFLYLFAASMLLGLAFGLGTSFLMKRAKSNSVPQVCACSPACALQLSHRIRGGAGDRFSQKDKRYLGQEGTPCPSAALPFWIWPLWALSALTERQHVHLVYSQLESGHAAAIYPASGTTA